MHGSFLVAAEVRERLPTSKQAAEKFDMERIDRRKLDDVGCTPSTGQLLMDKSMRVHVLKVHSYINSRLTRNLPKVMKFKI